MNVHLSASQAKPPGHLISEHEALDDYFPEECRPTPGWLRERVPTQAVRGAAFYFNREDVERLLLGHGSRAPR